MGDLSNNEPSLDGHRRLKKAGQRHKDRRRQRLEGLQRSQSSLPVTFALVGVQKAATSTLYRMVAHHPEVAAGSEKELRFFDDEDRDWSQPDYRDYRRPSTSSRCRLAGDGTPSYFFWPRALERMRTYEPEMRLLLSVRDPVERAMSQWSMQRHRDPTFPDVSDALERWGRMGVPETVPAGVSPGELRVTSLFARGQYGRQLERGLSFFERQQWCVLDFRAVVADSRTALDRVTDFLDVKRFADPPELKQRSATRSNHRGRPVTARDAEQLVSLYADDLVRFSELSGVDITAWPTHRVREGNVSVEDFARSLSQKLGLSS